MIKTNFDYIIAPPRWTRSKLSSPDWHRTIVELGICCWNFLMKILLSAPTPTTTQQSNHLTWKAIIDDSSVCPCILSPVIWYNLGLTCQILGTELGGETEDGLFYLRRSSYLYKKVISICRNGRQIRGLSTLLMAILNNQSCSLFEMGRYEEFWIAMRKLQCAIQTVARVSRTR